MRPEPPPRLGGSGLLRPASTFLALIERPAEETRELGFDFLHRERVDPAGGLERGGGGGGRGGPGRTGGGGGGGGGRAGSRGGRGGGGRRSRRSGRRRCGSRLGRRERRRRGRGSLRGWTRR